jgi:hypothetical protein
MICHRRLQRGLVSDKGRELRHAFSQLVSFRRVVLFVVLDSKKENLFKKRKSPESKNKKNYFPSIVGSILQKLFDAGDLHKSRFL